MNGERLLIDVLDRAAEAVDAAVSPQLLAVVPYEPNRNSVYGAVIRPIAERAVEAIDADELRRVIAEEPKLLDARVANPSMWRDRRTASDGRATDATLGDAIRATIEAVVDGYLRQHLVKRASEDA